MKLTIEPRNVPDKTRQKERDPLTNQRLDGKVNTGPKAIKSGLRAKGMIPACIYGQGVKGGKSEYVSIPAAELEAHLREMKKSGALLATSMFELSDGRSAIIKDIQYHKTNYKILHLDFYVVDKKKEITVNVPIQIEGAEDCVGVKLGGFLRQVIRTLKVKCLPTEIPAKFSLNVRELNHIAEGDKKPNKSKRLSDIALPKGVKPLVTEKQMHQVAATVGKRT